MTPCILVATYHITISKQEAQLLLSNRASPVYFAVARLLSVSVTQTCVIETYVRNSLSQNLLLQPRPL